MALFLLESASLYEVIGIKAKQLRFFIRYHSGTIEIGVDIRLPE